MFDASRCIHHACTIFIINLLTVFDSISSLNKPRVFLYFLIFFLWIIYLYSLRYIFMSYNTWNLKLPQYYNSFWDFNLRLLGFFFGMLNVKFLQLKKSLFMSIIKESLLIWRSYLEIVTIMIWNCFMGNVVQWKIVAKLSSVALQSN